MNALAGAGGGEHERAFELFGTQVRILVGAPLRRGLPAPEVASLEVEVALRHHHRVLTRFEAGSELTRLNRDEREEVPISVLMGRALGAALWAAERSSGLVDPTLLGELERAGYGTSLVGVAPAPLTEALLAAPARQPARPQENPAWQRIRVREGNVQRPPGLRLDLGGTAKGLAADEAAAALEGYGSFVIDVGGDMVIGGAAENPRLVEVAHPLGPQPAARFDVATGAVATSGLATRVWRTASGFAHHLIDPSSRTPAWTGIVQATALAGGGLEAEMLAKGAVLSGPETGLRLLERQGGVLVLDGGEVLMSGPLQAYGEPAAA